MKGILRSSVLIVLSESGCDARVNLAQMCVFATRTVGVMTTKLLQAKQWLSIYSLPTKTRSGRDGLLNSAGRNLH